jgi:hypothetical protein
MGAASVAISSTPCEEPSVSALRRARSRRSCRSEDMPLPASEQAAVFVPALSLECQESRV